MAALVASAAACGGSSGTSSSMLRQASSPLTGAIWTTDATCNTVNDNLFAAKEDVYLNGGPSGGGPGLPDGLYYARVTEPNGGVLGKTLGATVQVTGGHVATCARLTEILYSASSGFTALGYDDTANSGGEYKLWLSPDADFQSRKTDNFKVVRDPPSVSYSISGMKCYDTDVDGVCESGEPGIEDWPIRIFGGPSGFTPEYTETVSLGTYEFSLLAAGTYGVCEYIPPYSGWVNTTPIEIGGIELGPSATYEDFGNVCLGPGGGMTLGFWSNKNGWACMNGACSAPDAQATGDFLAGLAMCPPLSPITLGTSVKGSYTPGTFQAWLLGGNAQDMTYMLSVQYVAMSLNVRFGKVSGSANVYAPGVPGASSNGFISIADLLAEAEAALAGCDPTDRANQEKIKNAIDDANNNLNFVQVPTGGVLPCAIPTTFGAFTCPSETP